jgi:hypothetical protein
MKSKKAPVHQKPKAEELIPVTKAGETIRIHPSQVAQHARLGWSVEAA